MVFSLSFVINQQGQMRNANVHVNVRRFFGDFNKQKSVRLRSD